MALKGQQGSSVQQAARDSTWGDWEVWRRQYEGGTIMRGSGQAQQSPDKHQVQGTEVLGQARRSNYP